MDQLKKDQTYMRQCLALAKKGMGYVSPNPLVGAVLVKNGKILSRGFHKKFGAPHAEIDALQKLKFNAKGATLYCNLEPCAHYGKTPPCVDRVIESGVKRVVIATRDPNPKVAGKSVKALRKAGIEVTEGVLKDEAQFLNRGFFKWVTQKLPYVIVKVAMSLDGKITPTGQKTGRVTGPQSEKRVHQLRSEVDAILVGGGTVKADNPRLTVRLKKKTPQPLRVVLASSFLPSKNLNLIKAPGRVLWISKKHNALRQKPIENQHLEVLFVDSSSRLPVSPKLVLKELSKRGVTKLLVEGGSQVFSSFLNAGLVDELIYMVAPRWFGENATEAFVNLNKNALSRFKPVSITHHGNDWEICFNSQN